jgi:hypothetical protein
VTLTDGANPANTFTTSFANAGGIGADFGVLRQGLAAGVGFFDGISVLIEDRAAVAAELFDRNADTGLAYSAFNEETCTGRAFVADGQLVLAPATLGSDVLFTRCGPTGAAEISARVGADASDGSYSVGLVIGENNIVFHPGYGGGALRVEGPGGFGNTNVGFTPANGVLHNLEVTCDGAGGFDVTLTDGANPANVFTASFTNAGSVGGPVGFRRAGPSLGRGFFDDLMIDSMSESFDVDTDARALYPDFTATLNGGHAVVANGVLELAAQHDSNTVQTMLTDGVAGVFQLSALVGADNSNGDYSVGLTIGDNNVVFHPGYTGGALRVEGPGGFGNTNVGFTPANGVLHRMQVDADAAGNFSITLIDGTDPSNRFEASFFNPGSVGGPLGFRRSGQGLGVGLFDNLIVTVPEPASLGLLALGGICLLAYGWCRRVFTAIGK